MIKTTGSVGVESEALALCVVLVVMGIACRLVVDGGWLAGW